MDGSERWVHVQEMIFAMHKKVSEYEEELREVYLKQAKQLEEARKKKIQRNLIQIKQLEEKKNVYQTQEIEEQKNKERKEMFKKLREDTNLTNFIDEEISISSDSISSYLPSEFERDSDGEYSDSGSYHSSESSSSKYSTMLEYSDDEIKKFEESQEKEEKQQNEQQQQYLAGSLYLGDIPNSIISCKKNQDNTVIFLIDWKIRSNGQKPIASKILAKVLRKKYSILILQYYESKIRKNLKLL